MSEQYGMLHTILTGVKKRTDVDCRLGGIVVVLDDAIKSKFKACKCGLQARRHCSRSVGVSQEATAEIKCSV